jgi:chromosome segregation ATPase
MKEWCEEAETSLRLLARDDREKELLKNLAKRDGAVVAAARSDLVLNDEFYVEQLATATDTIDTLQTENKNLRAQVMALTEQLAQVIFHYALPLLIYTVR